MPSRPVAMISSTAKDLPDHREQVRLACEQAGFAPHEMMENFAALDANAAEASLKMVDDADVYIGIFAFRYGYVPDGADISVTEMEYNRAIEKKKPRLVFFMDGKHPITPDMVETGDVPTNKLAALKERAGKDRVAGFFKNPDDLRALVLASLNQFKASLEQNQAELHEKAVVIRQSQEEISASRPITPKLIRGEQVRDNFTKLTITEIAKAVGYRCSNPDCMRPTVGANAEQDGLITIGVAAHIHAASPGGPRYDPAQTREQRRGKNNGIWLCQSCGRLIDADPKRFSTEVLSGWKRAAQERAFRELLNAGSPALVEEAKRVGGLTATDKASIADADFDALFANVHGAAGVDLAASQRAVMRSTDTVELTLSLPDEDSVRRFSIGQLPSALEVAPETVVVAPPGTGKTTTLFQLARQLISSKSTIPIYFRLGDWSASSLNLLESLHERFAFKNISPHDMRQLADHGRLLLLLDGWNELDSAARQKLRIELDRIRGECPYIRIIATTRRQALDVPVSGPQIEIEALSEDQQMAIARARLGSDGEKIIDEAWRTPGVRELVATPLYLSALLSISSRGSSPTTKEEVLRLFVEQHEQASDHAEALQATLFGCHAQVLTALASHLNIAGSTVMTEADARQTVTKVVKQLLGQGQMAHQLEPMLVLEALTNHHTLIRLGEGHWTISFQHQQFQEWFASHEVAELLRASAKGNADARNRLRVAILDQPAWEESILFAVERMSHEDGDAVVVAHAVRLTLGIDPMLAAEMVFRSSSAIWEILSTEIIAFVDRWDHPGTGDRAVRFMIMTGRPEFQARIWPLASSEDTQIQLPTLRSAPRFRPSVLGPDARTKIAVLPEKTRERLVALIASEGGVDGMDLATELAKADPSPEVQAKVIQSLHFRRADRHVASLLAAAHDATWTIVAKDGYADEILNPDAKTRMQEERQRSLDQATDPLERLRLLLDQPPDYPSRDAAISATIADSRFPVRGQDNDSLLFYAQEQAQAAVLKGLRQRLEAGLDLPFRARDLLPKLEVTDNGAISAAILDVSQDNRDINAAAVIAGPRTVGALIDRYLACVHSLSAKRNDRTLSDEYQRILSRISATRPSSFLTAVMARAGIDNTEVISALAYLISIHGDHQDRELPIPVEPDRKTELTGILRCWVETVISSPSASRSDLCNVSNTIGRFAFAELVDELRLLLDEDLKRLRVAKDGYLSAQKRGDIRATSDASMRYGNQYAKALIRIGGEEAAAVAAGYLEDRVFGVDAALVLKAISDKQLNVPEESPFRQWPLFDEVADAREKRAASVQEAPATTLAVPIFAAIDRLTNPDADRESQLLAGELAPIALTMPHLDQDKLIARVMTLPQPLKSRRKLLAALALDGQVLERDAVVRGVDEWLQEAQNNPWHNRQSTWEIESWLELLPYTNQPDALIEELARVKAFYGSAYRKRFERVLTAVAAVPGPEGETLIVALARAHSEIADGYQWMQTFLGRKTASAVSLYIELFIEGVFGQGRQSVSTWHAARELTTYLQRFPNIEENLRRRYETDANGTLRALFEQLVGEIGGEQNFVAMFRKYAATGQRYDNSMAQAIRAVTLQHELVSEGSNSYHVQPAHVGQLRRHLFGMLQEFRQEASLARSCLNAIDTLRDEYGTAANDTRHPDVQSDIPWPEEAGQ